ncbi:MAG: hypothetical protein HKN31_09160 [Pricia sp.]|nr:hypothetical protein [Pricia sp.]
MVVASFALIFDFGLVVLIWLVQLVIYPSFKFYANEELLMWHKLYVSRIALVVIPLMIGQIIISAVQLTMSQSLYTVGSFLIVVFLWIFTFTHFAPLHKRISKSSANAAKIEKLVKRNWGRTILWTLVFVLELVQQGLYPME